MIVSMHRGSVAPLDIEAVFSIVSDALRAGARARPRRGREAPVPFAWLASGARRDAKLCRAPISTAPSLEGITRPWRWTRCCGRISPPWRSVRPKCSSPAAFTPTSTGRALLTRCLCARSTPGRQQAVRLEDPTQDKALVLTSVLVDSRPVFGAAVGEMMTETFRPAREHPALLRMLARFSLSHRPPRAF